MPDALSWDLDGRNWPNRDASRFVRSAGINWHVQVLGSGLIILLGEADSRREPSLAFLRRTVGLWMGTAADKRSLRTAT
jgi:hypothetical protein